MDDLTIIELYFARNEKAIVETDKKYGKLCFSVANNILFNDQRGPRALWHIFVRLSVSCL